MYSYHFAQWVAFFIIYCFVGWAFESVYVSIEHRKWVNRGFLNGPFLPIYGFGALIMLICALPVRDNVILIFLFGMAGATILEYFTGYMMERIFHAKYWDYTYEPFNLNGYICLGCSLMWGGLSILLVRVIHEPVEKLVLGINLTAISVFDIVFAVYFAWDIIESAREAFDLKKIIDEQIFQNESVMRIQKRIDVLVAFAEDDKKRLNGKLAESMEELQNKISEGKDEFQSMLAENREERQKKRDAEREEFLAKISDAKTEIEELRAELDEYKSRYKEKVSTFKKRASRMLKRNPTAVTKKSANTKKRQKLYELFSELFKD